MRLTWILPSACVALAALAVCVATVGAKQSDSSQIRHEVDQLLGQLDSDQYPTRRQASRRLDELAARKDLAPLLAAELQRALVRSDLSLEVRKQLEVLVRRLPPVAELPVEDVPIEEVERLVRQLESDRYGERLGAARRLQWLLGSPQLVSPIMIGLKQRVLRAGLSVDARQWLEPIAEKARGAWLVSDPQSWDLPPVSDAQIRQWIDSLVRPETEGDDAHPGSSRIAERELRDLLARDDAVPEVKAALEAKLAEEGIDRVAAQRLQALLDLTRPAMVAEFWLGRQQKGTQHLLVGVPSWGQLAERASHFDRIDDQTAHCVSGQNLSPGEYPVGVAIPHPNPRLEGAAFFHLVNLPTPRRRMAYEYIQRYGSTQRLAEISRHTVDRFLKRKAHLSEPELVLLIQLDPDIMSDFAARMLLAIDDQPLPQGRLERLGGRSTHHGMLCSALAHAGTHAAIPALLDAIQAQRVLPPSAQAPYHLDWIAAMAIATRDPWRGVDPWLAGLVGRRETLAQERPAAPEFGATAAGILLERHKQHPFAFGLEAANDPTLEQLEVQGYRFSSSEGPGLVQRWWSQQNEEPATEANTRP